MAKTSKQVHFLTLSIYFDFFLPQPYYNYYYKIYFFFIYNILAGIFTSAGAEEDDPTFSYKDSEGKRFYYCERAGHHDSCGFNKKVDIYALGITILSMVE